MVVRKESRFTALDEAAAVMAPGTFTTFFMPGLLEAFTGTGGSSGILNAYSSKMARDSIRRQIHFIASDHGGPYRHIRYDEVRHIVENLGTPSWWDGDIDHGYQEIAIDVAGRNLFRKRYDSGTVRVFSVNADDTTNAANWSTLPASGEGGFSVNVLEYFDELGWLLTMSQSGLLLVWRKSTNDWVDASPAEMNEELSSSWMFFTRNPVRQEVLLGSSTNDHWKMNASGVLTKLADIPADYSTYNGFGQTGGWTVNGLNGKNIVWTHPTIGTGRNLYEFDSSDESYSAIAGFPNKQPNGNMVAVPIPGANVTLFAGAKTVGGTETWSYLYKWAA